MPLSVTAPYGQKHYMGEYASDTAANSAISAVGWTLANGILYYNTTDNVMKVYAAGTWKELAAGALDHGSMLGLTDDDHPQYALVDGTRPFTGAVGGVSAGGDTSKLATLGDVRAEVEGLSYKQPVDAATTSPLPANTRSTDVLTATSNSIFPTIDGIVPLVGKTYLIKNEVNAVNNGIYTLTQLGGATSPWKLTRRDDFNDGDTVGNAIVSVDGGLQNADKTFRCVNDKGADEVNTASLQFANFGATPDHGQLQGLGDDDHPQYHNNTRGDARYFQKSQHIDARTNVSDAGKPVLTDTSGYVNSTFIDSSSIDHGSISGLADDDHPQYHNDSRGDQRYFRKNEFVASSAGLVDAGKPVTLDAAGKLAGSLLDNAVIDHGSISGLADDDHPQYHNDARGDQRYYKKAETPLVQTGSGNPNGSVTPTKVGDIYIDTANQIKYSSVGTSNTSWIVD